MLAQKMNPAPSMQGEQGMVGEPHKGLRCAEEKKKGGGCSDAPRKRKAARAVKGQISQKKQRQNPNSHKAKAVDSASGGAHGKPNGNLKKLPQTKDLKLRKQCYFILRREENKRIRAAFLVLEKKFGGLTYKQKGEAGDRAQKLILKIGKFILGQQEKQPQLVPYFWKIASKHLRGNRKNGEAPPGFKSVFDTLWPGSEKAGTTCSRSDSRAKAESSGTGKIAGRTTAESVPKAQKQGSLADSKTEDEIATKNAYVAIPYEIPDHWAKCPRKGLSCLVLGLNFVNEEEARKYGSRHVIFRDRTRMIALQDQGWSAYTISLPEIENHAGERGPNGGNRRVHGTFGRRVVRELKDSYRETKPFHTVFLEYIRMPGEYGRRAYDKALWSEMLPEMFRQRYITGQTPLYVYNAKEIIQHLKDANRRARSKGQHYGYEWKPVEANTCALFTATQKIDHLLPIYNNTAWIKDANEGKIAVDCRNPFLKLKMVDSPPSGSDDSDAHDEIFSPEVAKFCRESSDSDSSVDGKDSEDEDEDSEESGSEEVEESVKKALDRCNVSTMKGACTSTPKVAQNRNKNIKMKEPSKSEDYKIFPANGEKKKNISTKDAKPSIMDDEDDSDDSSDGDVNLLASFNAKQRSLNLKNRVAGNGGNATSGGV